MKKTILTVACTALLTVLTMNFFQGRFVQQEKLDTGKLKRVERMIEQRFYGEVGDITDYALTGMLLSLDDKYSDYYGQERYENLVASLEGSYEGIGVEIYVDPTDNLLTILSPYEDAPADRAGLIPRDKIIKINDLDVSGTNFDEAVDYMRGRSPESKDSPSMTFVVLRDGKTLEVTLEREVVEVNTVKGYMLEGCLYIRLAGFDEITLEKFRGILEEHEDYSGLIIDLRNNPGGIFSTSINIANEMLPEGKLIVYSETKDGKQTKYYSNAHVGVDKPVVLLLNQNSASASEVLAGALKDNGRAVVVGEKSFGKGIVQDIISLGDGTAVKFTTAKYYTPSGVCIDKIGIQPDYQVSLPEELNSTPVNKLTFSQDLFLQKAVEIIKSQE